jgi:lysophospholipase L1-like esterase
VRRITCSFIGAAVLVTALTAAPPAASSAAVAGDPGSPTTATVDPVPSGDEIVTATADTSGYHLFGAAAGDGWRWHTLATLQPGGYGEEQWIGEHCLTGDGRSVIAVVAPWRANNSPGGLAAGGIAYAVDAHTGAVRSLVAGVAVAYFNPGCGTGSSAALTRYLSPDESATQLLTVDTRTGSVAATARISAQVTSAIPVDGRLFGVNGHRLVQITADGRMRQMSRHRGPVFGLTPNSSGGVDYLAADSPAGPDVTGGVYRLAAGAVSRLTSGRLSTLHVSARPVGARTADVSRLGTMAVRHGNADRDRVGLAGVTTPTSGGGALPVPAGAFTAVPSVTVSPAAVSGAARSGIADSADPPDDGGAAARKCAVQRNDPDFQVPQPSASMVDWALNLAGQYALPTRADGRFNLHTGAYNPSADFPLPAPFDGAAGIPRQIMEGIFAQESNFSQASPHAPPGLSGNPYIADYYGIYNRRNLTGFIDFSLADCGYGLGQITDMMSLANPGDQPSARQQRVAVDYAENAAATAQVLAQKWNTLSQAGVTLGDANPMEIENWYFAIWAYNSGINPQASTGGGSCTPGPGCADSAGNWGLGWTNNPENATYYPLRHPFLHDEFGDLTYDDAAHPQEWPYQEKVFGWIESGQYAANGVTLKYPPTHDYSDGSGYFLYLPDVYAFCDASDDCDPLSILQPCGHSDDADPLQWHCWWHEPASFCPSTCHLGDWNAAVGRPEPTVANPFPSICAPPTSFSDAIIVDDDASETNLAGCSGMRRAAGSATWIPNRDPNGGPFGEIDLHQLGTGYGGRSMFTHMEEPDNAIWGGTMVWAPGNLDYDRYDIEVFVPTLGAAGTLTYFVVDHGRVIAQQQVDQNDFGNEWVSLGTYQLSPGAYVSTTNVVPGGDGVTDVSFDAVAFRPVASYAAIGDSYSSGQGAGDYDEGTDTADNTCKRSPYAFPRQYAATTPSGAIAHLACSGARLANLTSLGQFGEPAQISAIPAHANLVTVTVGGNDAGFADVLTRCALPSTSRCEDYYTQDDEHNLDVIIDSLRPRLATAYTAIRNRAPDARVVAVAYPNIFSPGSEGKTQTTCLSIGAMAEDDVEWLIGELFHLDNVIFEAARDAGVEVLDERYAFLGHELCTSDPWVNGLLTPPVTDYTKAFHPTPAGYARIAADLESPPRVMLWSDWEKPLPGVPTRDEAIRMLNDRQRIPIRDPSAAVYPGNDGFATWRRYRATCNVRTQVLTRDGQHLSFVLDPAGNETCTIAGGTWQSPYDDPYGGLAHVSGDPMVDDSVVDVDHVVSKKDAWLMGADRWDIHRRTDFANDLDAPELLSVSSAANGDKLDKTPDLWTPDNRGNFDFTCDFLAMYVAVKWKWELGVTRDQYYSIGSQLLGCPS